MVQFGAELFEGCFSTLVNEFIDKPLRIYENDLSRLRSETNDDFYDIWSFTFGVIYKNAGM